MRTAKRKLSGIGLIAVMCLIPFFVVLQVRAGESDGNHVVEDADFTVTIPAEVTIDSTTKQADLPVNIKLNRTNRLTVSVASDNNYQLKNGDDAIKYTIDKNSLSAASTNVTSQYVESNGKIHLSVESGAVPKYAGEYTDQLTFSISSTSVNYIDLNGILDGTEITGGNLTGVATVPIYVNGNSYGYRDDVWENVPVGTVFKADVDNIKVNDGYTYVGSKDGTEKTVTKDVKWVRIDLMFVTNYTLTLNACGGSCSQSSFSVGQSLNYYDKIKDIIPTREGYTFDGWYTAEAGVSGADKITESNAVMEPYDTTIYAHWSKDSVADYYLDFNSYDLDEQRHHETVGDYGSATIKINGNETSHDYGQVASGTTFEISNMQATKEGYEYKGCYICYHPVREGEELNITEGQLNTSETITGTVTSYTNVYLVFGKIDSTDTEEAAIQITSETDKTKKETEKEKNSLEGTESESDTKTDTANKTSTDTTADQSKDTSSTDAATDTNKTTETDKTTDADQSGTGTGTEGKSDASDTGDSSSGDASGKTDSKDTTGGTDSTSGGSSGSSSDSTADGSSGSTDGTTSGSSTDSSAGGSSDSNTDSAANGSSDSSTEAATDGNSDASADSTSADAT